MSKSFKKISDSAAAREQQSKIDALLSGTTNYPADDSPTEGKTTVPGDFVAGQKFSSSTPSTNIQTKIPLPLFEALNRIKLYTGKPIVDILREALTEYVDRHKV